MLMFTGFGRRIRACGSGTGRGVSGVLFVLGNRVNGGWYSDILPLGPGWHILSVQATDNTENLRPIEKFWNAEGMRNNMANR